MLFFLRCFSILCYASGFYMLLFFRQMFLTRACVCVCVCVCVVHWHCTAQLSMFNMEKRFRNKIIIIIIKPATLWTASPNTTNELFRPQIRGTNPTFPSQVIPMTTRSVLLWLPCQVPGVAGSSLGLVGMVSVCCAWVR